MKDTSMKAERKRSEGTSPDKGEAEKSVPGEKRRRKRRITIFLLVCLLNVGLLALLWSQLSTPAQNQSQVEQMPRAGVSGAAAVKNSPGYRDPEVIVPLLQEWVARCQARRARDLPGCTEW